jgi:hypothetical protein
MVIFEFIQRPEYLKPGMKLVNGLLLGSSTVYSHSDSYPERDPPRFVLTYDQLEDRSDLCGCRAWGL